MRAQMTRPDPCKREATERGISLILVMLSMTVLSVLAATIVFTANSETFASHSYRLDTEADYVAKAGIQQALNWFRSSHYLAVQQGQAPTYYNVTSDGTVWSLYTAKTAPLKCVSAVSTQCPSQNSTVQLITYGSGSSNYPADLTNTLGSLVATDFQTSLQNVSVAGDPTNFGYFCINAYLLNYETLNCPTCPVSPVPLETWLVTSLGTWGGTSCANGALATAEEQAIIQPIYTSNFGNALYGYCGVTMGGSTGSCTDAFNSALGAYGGGNVSVASGACDSSSPNVIDSGAGVGGNGYVNLGMSGNVSVSGNVTIGNVGYTAPSSCCTGTSNPPCGYSGNGTVQGTVLNGPPVPVPAAPTFPAGFPGSGATAAPSYSSTVTLPQTVAGAPPPTPAPPALPAPITPGPGNIYTNPCMSTAVCNGSSANPYLISNVSLSGGGASNTVTFFGGPDVSHPAYYDIDSLGESGSGSISVIGFVVLNVRTNLSITGNGIANPLTTEPEAVQINYAGTTAATIQGNGAISAIITAPNATVNLGGGGSNGYMVGAIRAANVNVGGGYPIHYDIQLNRLEGTKGQMVVSSYSRIKQ